MSSTISGTDTNGGETWTCTVTPNDGDEDGTVASTSVNIEASCVYGVGEECPGIDCLDILDSGYSTGDGTYWIDPLETGAYEVHCVMDATYDGGGWTLTAVSSDDAQDTWTWNNRNYWDTDTTTFGDLGSLNKDFKSLAYHQAGMTDLLFVHSPSGVWASYRMEDSLQDLGFYLSGLEPSIDWEGMTGHLMVSGTLTVGDDLCTTSLYFNAQDKDGGNSGGWRHDSYGPTWNTDNPLWPDGCLFDDTGYTGSLGPCAEPTDCPPDGEYGVTTPDAVGFGWARGLNSGSDGAAENYMWVLVRR
jgi:hypothetical protein